MPVVKNYSCQNCGAVIGNITSASGQCEYCGTSFVVESIRNCSDFVRNEDIKCGIPLSAEPEKLYKYVRDFLTSSSAPPSDVLENAKITSCQNMCLPAYYYHYNGTASFTCQVAKTVESVSDGRTVRNTEWQPFGNNIYADVEGIASGNPQYDAVIDEMYGEYNPDIIIDAESLEIPENIETVKFSRPASEVLNRYVRKDIDDTLRKNAENQLDSMSGYRNLVVSSARPQKDSEYKLIAGLYCINLEYKGNDYSLYVSGDGKKVIYNNSAPKDNEKDTVLNNLRKAQSDAESAFSMNNKLTVAAFIIAVICLLIMPVALKIIGGLGGMAGGIFLSVKKKPPLETALGNATEKLNNFNNAQQETFDNFDRNGLLIQGSQYLGMR